MDEERKPIKAFIAIEDDAEYEMRKQINQKNLDFMMEGVREEVKSAAMVKAKTADTKSPEEKEYILLLYTENGDAPGPWWEICTGRTEAYERIKQYIELLEIHDSYVLVEGLPSERRITVYQFMRHIQDKEFYNDSFDIEDYNTGSDEEEQEEEPAQQQEANGEEDGQDMTPILPFRHLDANEVNL